MFSPILREGRLGSEHLKETTESTQERDFARLAIFMRFPAAEPGQQLHFDPFEGDPRSKRKPAATHANELVVGVSTVEAHISHIFTKLGFSSRAQIAAWAVDKGLAQVPQDREGSTNVD